MRIWVLYGYDYEMIIRQEPKNSYPNGKNAHSAFILTRRYILLKQLTMSSISMVTHPGYCKL